MKRLIILFVLLLLLGGGGGGVAYWWFVLRGAEPEVAAAPPVLKFEYVELTPFVVPIIRERQVTQHLTVKVVLQVVAGTGVARTKALRPRLTDAFLSELHGLYDKRFVQDSADAVPILSKRLRQVGARVLGPGVIEDVLVQIKDQTDTPKAAS